MSLRAGGHAIAIACGSGEFFWWGPGPGDPPYALRSQLHAPGARRRDSSADIQCETVRRRYQPRRAGRSEEG